MTFGVRISRSRLEIDLGEQKSTGDERRIKCITKRREPGLAKEEKRSAQSEEPRLEIRKDKREEADLSVGNWIFVCWRL